MFYKNRVTISTYAKSTFVTLGATKYILSTKTGHHKLSSAHCISVYIIYINGDILPQINVCVHSLVHSPQSWYSPHTCSTSGKEIGKDIHAHPEPTQ